MNTHTTRSPHGPMHLLHVERPSAWKALFNPPEAMVNATRYVYDRPSTQELVVTDPRGRVVELRPY